MRISPLRHRRDAADAGAALAEMLVAMTIAALALTAAVTFVWDQLDAAATQPETADLQQRARVAGQLLNDGIITAGVWGDHGGTFDSASCCLPVVQPRRLGSRSPDPPGTARGDVLTILRSRLNATVFRVDQQLAGNLTFAPSPGCPTDRVACGLREDDHLMLFEQSGRHDYFVVTAVSASMATVSARQQAQSGSYDGDAFALAVETLTYSFDPIRRQLRLYDGYNSDMPVVDDVVALRFEYFGEAGVPPRLRADGESCWFDEAGAVKFGRTVTPAGSALVAFDLADFEDGPWCGEGENRFDADLLRVRLVRAAVRLQASVPAARGFSSAFLNPGRATRGRRFVPDEEVVIASSLRAPGAT